jgi:hypothetical protein
MRHIFESLLTMEGKSWSGSWARASSTRAKAQQASIVQAFVHVQVDLQVEVEVHDEQVAWVSDYGEKPQEWREMKWKG